MTQLVETIFTNPIIAFIVLVGIVVFVHELGHFLVGRWLGVDVEEFSLGFGPRAFSFKKGMTRYQICWLPLGGYVRFYGAEIGQDIPLEKREKSITTAKLYKRALISAAGPGANFVLSLFIMTFLWNIGMPSPAPVISVIPGSVAEKAGLRTGDKITRIQNEDVKTWLDINKAISANAGKPLDVIVDRDGHVQNIHVVPAEDEIQSVYGEQVKVGRIGVSQFLLTPRLVIAENSFFAAAGLKTGDLVTEWDGQKIRYLYQLNNALAKTFGSDVDADIAKVIASANTPLAPINLKITRVDTSTFESLSAKLKRTDDPSVPQDLTIDPGAQAMKAWAQTQLSAHSMSRAPSAAITTDLTLREYETLKKDDKRQAALDAWKECGFVPGHTLLAIEEIGTVTTPVQLAAWVEKLQTRLTATSQPALTSVPVKMTVAEYAGAVRNLECKIPVRVGKDTLNRDQAFFDLPFTFLTRGVPVEPVIVKSENIVASFGDGAKAAGEQATAIFVGLKKLFSGSVPLANLGGPIAIARVAGDAAEGGFFIFVLTISWMSVNIGMFNLLPLPALDGGTLLMHAVEGAYGKPLPISVQQIVQRVGIFIILGLIVLVFYNDILRLFHS